SSPLGEFNRYYDRVVALEGFSRSGVSDEWISAFVSKHWDELMSPFGGALRSVVAAHAPESVMDRLRAALSKSGDVEVVATHLLDIASRIGLEEAALKIAKSALAQVDDFWLGSAIRRLDHLDEFLTECFVERIEAVHSIDDR